MADLTVNELQHKRLLLELEINRLLNKFTEETGYSVEDVKVERQLSERYHYGVYTSLGYLVGVSVDISVEYKLRAGGLVKSSTWIDDKGGEG